MWGFRCQYWDPKCSIACDLGLLLCRGLWALMASGVWRLCSVEQAAGRSPPSSTTQLCWSPAPRDTCSGHALWARISINKYIFCCRIKCTAELAEIMVRSALNHSPGGRLGLPPSRGALAPRGAGHFTAHRLVRHGVSTQLRFVSSMGG